MTSTFASEPTPDRFPTGNQTLARGLTALLAIADSEAGLSPQEVSALLNVHRSIAYRTLQTLEGFGLISRNRDGVYVSGARLATLSDTYLPYLREAALDVMRSYADKLQSTVSLFVEQGSYAVAVAMVEPTNVSHHIAFRLGMRTPMTVGAAAYAMVAAKPPQSGEPEAVTTARAVGYARSHGEVETGAYGVAAAIPTGPLQISACLNMITYREDVADGAGPDLRAAADEVGRKLARR